MAVWLLSVTSDHVHRTSYSTLCSSGAAALCHHRSRHPLSARIYLCGMASDKFLGTVLQQISSVFHDAWLRSTFPVDSTRRNVQDRLLPIVFYDDCATYLMVHHLRFITPTSSLCWLLRRCRFVLLTWVCKLWFGWACGYMYVIVLNIEMGKENSCD